MIHPTEDFIKIYKQFGFQNQRRKLQEEVQELNDEIMFFENGIGGIDELKEELADVYILLMEIKEYYEITDSELSREIVNKTERTLERIENGYYEKEGSK